MSKLKSAGEPAKTHLSDKPDEGLFADLPSNITQGQLKTAWKVRELIWRLVADGRTPYQISPNVHVPVRVVEFINSKRPASTVSPSFPISEGRAQEISARARPEGGNVSAHAPTEVPPSMPVPAPAGVPVDATAGVSDVPVVVPRDRRFERKIPSGDDLIRARASADRIHELGRAGLSSGRIARVVHLPVAVVDLVLEESDYSPPESNELGSWGLDVGEREIRSAVGGPIVADSITREIERIVKLSGGGPNQASLIAERFAYYRPDDYTALERILLESGATPATARSAIGLYRERTGEVLGRKAGRDDEQDDDSPRARMRELDRRQMDALVLREYEARLKLLEREASGASAAPAPTGPTEREKELAAQVESLKEAARRSEIAELERRYDEKIRSLESRLSARRTFEDVEVDGAYRAMSRKDQAQAGVIEEAGARLRTAPHLLEEVSPILKGLQPQLQNRARKILAEPGDLEGKLVEQSEEEMKAALARLEAGLSGSEMPVSPPEATEPAPPVDGPARRIKIPTHEQQQPAIKIAGTGSIESR